MKKRTDLVFWWIELFAGLGFLAVGFLQDCSLTFGTKIISCVLWPTLALSALVCVYKFLHIRAYKNSCGFWLIIALCAAYLVSLILNRRYGWYDNFRTLIMQGVLFAVAYFYKGKETPEDQRKRQIWTAFYLAVCAVMTAVGFAYMLLGKNKIYYPTSPDMPLYYTGFYWGRLYGIYWDPNIGALMCCVSLLLAADIFIRYRNLILRIVMALLVVLDVFYITFSDSRACRIALVVGTAVMAVYYFMKNRKRRAVMVGAAAAIVLAVLLPSVIKSGYNSFMTAALAAEKTQAASSVSHSAASKTESSESKKTESSAAESKAESSTSSAASMTDTKPSKPSGAANANHSEATQLTIRPKEANAADISNRRLDIWKSALEIFKAKPIFGVGHNTVLAFVENEQPDSYLINNDHMRFSSMHNAFLDILVAQGAVGLLLYLGIAVLCLIVLIQNRKKVCENLGGTAAMALAVLAAMVCASCFMSEILYVCSPMSFIFWMLLRVLMQAADTGKRVKEEQPCRKS